MDLSHNLQLRIRIVNFIETMHFVLQMIPFVFYTCCLDNFMIMQDQLSINIYTSLYTLSIIGSLSINVSLQGPCIAYEV